MSKEQIPVLLSVIQSFTDTRGSIDKFLPSVDIKDVLRIKSTVGSIRANHYHRKDYHLCLLTKGKMKYYERSVGSVEKPYVLTILPGDFFYTGPMLEHAMEFLEDSEFWCFSHLSRQQEDYEKDTVRLDFDLTKK